MKIYDKEFISSFSSFLGFSLSNILCCQIFRNYIACFEYQSRYLTKNTIAPLRDHALILIQNGLSCGMIYFHEVGGDNYGMGHQKVPVLCLYKVGIYLCNGNGTFGTQYGPFTGELCGAFNG